MSNRCFLLLDVGGTFVKSVVATLEGELLLDTENSVPIDSDGTRLEIEQSFATVIANGKSIAEGKGLVLAGVGIAFPGPFNYHTGVSLMKHKFAVLDGVSVKDFFHSLPEIGADMPVVFMHDVTAAVAGELAFGAAQAKVFEETACIRCGRCVRACPMSLMPAAIETAYKLKKEDDLKALKVNLCIECGFFSFVCPSHRPLVVTNKMAKRMIAPKK